MKLHISVQPQKHSGSSTRNWCYNWDTHGTTKKWRAVQCISRKSETFVLSNLEDSHDVISIAMKMKNQINGFTRYNTPAELSDAD